MFGDVSPGRSQYLGPYPSIVTETGFIANEGVEGPVGIYDLVGVRIGAVQDGQASQIVSSPDGSQIAIASGKGRVALFDLKTMKELWSRSFAEKDSTSISDLAFAQSGQFIIVALFAGQAVILDASTGRLVQSVTLGKDRNVVSACLSPDGSYAALVDLLDRVNIVEVASHRRVGVFHGHWPVRYSGDGRFVACPSGDSGMHLRVVAADQLDTFKDLGSFQGIGRIKVSTGGNFLLTTVEGGGMIAGFVCDPAKGEMHLSWEASSSLIGRIADFDPERRVLVSTDNSFTTRIVEFRDNRIIEIGPRRFGRLESEPVVRQKSVIATIVLGVVVAIASLILIWLSVSRWRRNRQFKGT